MIPFFVFLFCLFTTYATYLIVTRKTAARRARVGQRLADLLAYIPDAEVAPVSLSRDEPMSKMPMLNRWLTDAPSAVRLRRLIDQADLHLTAPRLFKFSAAAGILGTLAVSMITHCPPIMIGAGGAAAAIPLLHVVWKRQRRFDKFLADLPEALDLICRALSAGQGFSEAMNMVSREMSNPIAMEFRRTHEEHNLGLSSKVALENLAQRVPLLDLRLCVTAVQIQRETGGNLAEILEKVSNTIRERFRIMEDLRTLTTQSRMSAWVLCLLPILIAVVMAVANPEYMSVLWRDPRGHKMIAVALGMQLIGMLMVRKIMRIRI
ncbi:MAG TPA: type II secretion system F family protein [Blastocatellia bacterium]|nr:type II secretion system F family protein [Blastocatellia bacterium]